jgi:hypothetical protein
MDSTPAAPRSPVADALYDARRGVYYTKPVLRGWLHLIWFGASLVLGTLLLVRMHGAARITAIAIYAASVSALFGISALYHCGNWTDAWRRRLQRLDHAMIFFLIAGTATPAFLLAMRGAFGLACLIVMWSLTLTAGAVHMARMVLPERLVGAMFLGLGWVAGRSADARGRPALHGRGDFLPSPPARPVPVGVRLPRGLSRLRLRRRDLPVHCDSSVHQLSRAPRKETPL